MKNKPLMLFLMVFIYIAIFSYATIRQHNAYNTTLYDLAIFDQVIWNTAHGRFFESSIKGFNFLGDHFSPILILISPLYHIFRDVRILLALQTFFLAIGAFPIYLIAKQEFKKESIALIFAFIYLAYPPLGYLNMFDFHPLSIAVPLLAWAFYLFKNKKWPLFYLCITGALLCKEEIGLVVIFLGIYIFITTRDFKNGILVFALGLLCFLCVTLFVIPHICKEQYLYFVRYKHLGPNIKEIISTVFLHPIYSLKTSFALRKLVNFIFVFLALGFTPFFSPACLLLVFPTIAYSYLSLVPTQSDIRYQYIAPIIPFLIIASIYGTKNVINWFRCNFKKPIICERVFLCFLLFIVVCASSIQIVVPLRRSPLAPRTSHKEIIEAEKLIPDEASLTAGNSLGSHFSRRRILLEYTADREPATEFVFLDLCRDFIWTKDQESFNASVLKIIRDKKYGIIYFNNGIILLKRGVEGNRIEEVALYLKTRRNSNLPSDNKMVLSIKKILQIDKKSSNFGG